MTYIDSVLLNLTERVCHRIQRLTGTTNIWLAVQLTNLSIICYFVFTAGVSWTSPTPVRVFLLLFCGGVFYALTQTLFKDPIELYEQFAYKRIQQGYRNPRRVRDALLRISFLTVSIVLIYPIVFLYINRRERVLLLSYLLVPLMTVVLYLLACDPLPPCRGRIKVREWFGRLARSRVPASESVEGA